MRYSARNIFRIDKQSVTNKVFEISECYNVTEHVEEKFLQAYATSVQKKKKKRFLQRYFLHEKVTSKIAYHSDVITVDL